MAHPRPCVIGRFNASTTATAGQAWLLEWVFEMVRDAIGKVLHARALSTPDRVCCAMDENVFTYAEMDRRSDALAAGLAQLGVGPGEQVAMLAPNRIEL